MSKTSLPKKRDSKIESVTEWDNELFLYETELFRGPATKTGDFRPFWIHSSLKAQAMIDPEGFCGLDEPDPRQISAVRSMGHKIKKQNGEEHGR